MLEKSIVRTLRAGAAGFALAVALQYGASARSDPQQAQTGRGNRLQFTEPSPLDFGDHEGYTAGFDEDTVRRTDKAPAPDPPRGSSGRKLFGSRHPGRLNAALADGSVRPISYGIDPTIFRYLGNISDGQPITGDDF